MKSLSRRQTDVYADMVERIRKGESIIDLFQESIAVADIPSERPEPKAIDGSLKRVPIIEQVDLTQFDSAGAIAGYFDVMLKKPFVRVSRLVVLQTWDAANVNYNNFGKTGPINSGFQISTGLQGHDLVSGTTIPDPNNPMLHTPIAALKDYMRYAYDTNIVVDTTGVNKYSFFTARFTFTKFMGGDEGIDMTGNNKIRITGPQDGEAAIGAKNDIAVWNFEGWGWDR